MNSLENRGPLTIENSLVSEFGNLTFEDGEAIPPGGDDGQVGDLLLFDTNLNRPLTVKSRSSYAQLGVHSMGIDLTRSPLIEPPPPAENTPALNNFDLTTTGDLFTNNNSNNMGKRVTTNTGFLDYYRLLESAVQQRRAGEELETEEDSNRNRRLTKSEWNCSSEKEQDESEEPLLPPASPLMKRAEDIGEAEADSLLPQGWERHLDDDGPYYWHISSGTIQREPPTLPGCGGTSHVPRQKQQAQRRLSENLDVVTKCAAPKEPFFDNDKQVKRQSYPQIGSSLDEDEGIGAGTMPLRFAVRSLGWAEVPEEDLTPERSSRAVNRCIVDLSQGRVRGAQGNQGGILDGVGRWGEGRDLLLELDGNQLRLLRPRDSAVLHCQPLHAIRVWGVGRDNGRDFAYVARDRTTRRFMCHVFRCDMPARIIANALRDVCKKMVVERSLIAESRAPRTTSVSSETGSEGRVSPTRHSPTEHSSSPVSLEEVEFPTPMEEPRKVLRARYLGAVPVTKPSGMEILNGAIDALIATVAKDRWLPVQVAVAPSTVTVTLDGPPGAREVLAECRVRFLSFLGIGKHVKNCGFIMRTAQDQFIAHVFHCDPSSGALCKTIEAACKLRYQKCLDAHQRISGKKNMEPQQQAGTLSTALKSVIGTLGTRLASFNRQASAQQAS
ncbi:protein Fe65 homolog [Ornithodoros turicata]|uniref:protein Fe65 homolog n=1 Tax=Ornithodoros turicata TaxID=34597 RepID=UPI00313A0487